MGLIALLADRVALENPVAPTSRRFGLSRVLAGEMLDEFAEELQLYEQQRRAEVFLRKLDAQGGGS